MPGQLDYFVALAVAATCEQSLCVRVEDQGLRFSHWTKVLFAEPPERLLSPLHHDFLISEKHCALRKIPPNCRHNSACCGDHKSVCHRRCSNGQRIPDKAERSAVRHQRHELLACADWRSPALYSIRRLFHSLLCQRLEAGCGQNSRGRH